MKITNSPFNNKEILSQTFLNMSLYNLLIDDNFMSRVKWLSDHFEYIAAQDPTPEGRDIDLTLKRETHNHKPDSEYPQPDSYIELLKQMDTSQKLSFETSIPSLVKRFIDISAGKTLEEWVKATQNDNFVFKDWVVARLKSHTLDNFISDAHKYSRPRSNEYGFILAAQNCIRIHEKELHEITKPTMSVKF